MEKTEKIQHFWLILAFFTLNNGRTDGRVDGRTNRRTQEMLKFKLTQKYASTDTHAHCMSLFHQHDQQMHGQKDKRMDGR